MPADNCSAGHGLRIGGAATTLGILPVLLTTWILARAMDLRQACIPPWQTQYLAIRPHSRSIRGASSSMPPAATWRRAVPTTAGTFRLPRLCATCRQAKHGSHQEPTNAPCPEARSMLYFPMEAEISRPPCFVHGQVQRRHNGGGDLFMPTTARQDRRTIHRAGKQRRRDPLAPKWQRLCLIKGAHEEQ